MARLLFNRLYPIDEFLNEQLADDTIRVTSVLIWGGLLLTLLLLLVFGTTVVNTTTNIY